MSIREFYRLLVKNNSNEPEYSISGNGIIHINSSELSKSEKVRNTAKAILQNRNKLIH
ncbi:MAG: hypothetical protein JW982_15750 [Spirochaetes bacterium]|nr:hypothetical protein [Spirochaetota bacterium]